MDFVCCLFYAVLVVLLMIDFKRGGVCGICVCCLTVVGVFYLRLYYFTCLIVLFILFFLYIVCTISLYDLHILVV